MNNYTYAIILTTIAAFSTILGVIPIFFKIKNKDKTISLSLSFSSGVMLSISLFALIKESFNYLNKVSNIILIIILLNLIGILASLIINTFLENKIKNKLYKTGIFSTIVIIMHNIPEGIITFLTSTINIKLGLIMCLSIMLHNIPEGISISMPIYYATKSKYKAIIFTAISGFSETLGGIISYILFKNIINKIFLGTVLSLTSGIMIYVSLVELLPLAVKTKKTTSVVSFTISFILTSLIINFLS